MAVKTPHITAKAQPAVMTIQPEFSALDFLRSTAATTPSPNKTSTSVPMNSPNQGESMPVPPWCCTHYFPQNRGKRKRPENAKGQGDGPGRSGDGLNGRRLAP